MRLCAPALPPHPVILPLLHLDPETLVSLGEIIWVNALLSGDNALVIALACRNLQGRQRWLGMSLGAALAVVLRIIFTIFIVELLHVPYLKIAGGLVLLWIATKLIADAHEDDSSTVAAGETLFHAVRTVVIADVAMSIDNVLAISAIAADNMVLLSIGIAISIPFVVAGASLIMGILSRFPILVWAGGALLGWVSGSMIAEEPVAISLIGSINQTHIILSIGGALLVLLVAAVLKQRTRTATPGGPPDSDGQP